MKDSVCIYETRYGLKMRHLIHGLSVTQIFENAAKGRFNEGASVVLKAAMKATEASQLSISDARSRMRIFLFFWTQLTKETSPNLYRKYRFAST